MSVSPSVEHSSQPEGLRGHSTARDDQVLQRVIYSVQRVHAN